jgi:hypothetical protein
MGRAHGLWLATTPWVLVLGCSLAFDPEEYYGPPDASADRRAITDGGVDSESRSDAPDEDAPRDAPATDADASEASSLRFCEGVDAAFCADFDESKSLIVGWSSSPSPLHSTSEGSLSLDTTIAKSKPASLHAKLPELDPDSSTFGEQLLEEDISTTWREVTLDFDFFISAVPSGAGVSLLEFTFEGDISAGVSMTLGTMKVDAGGLGGLGFTALTSSDAGGWLYGGYSYTPGKWTHVEFNVLPATSGHGKVLVSFDGTLVQMWTGISFESDPGASDLRLQLGLSQYGAYTPAFDIHYDNVVVRFP